VLRRPVGHAVLKELPPHAQVCRRLPSGRQVGAQQITDRMVDVAIQHALTDRPEPEAAAEAAGRALAYLPTVRSDRLLQQLHNVESALQRHAAVPAVADWLEEYRTRTGVS
jgi:hypothetical protein